MFGVSFFCFFFSVYSKGGIWVNKDCSSEIRCKVSLAVLSVSSAVLAKPQLQWELTITTFFFPPNRWIWGILKYESRCQVAAFNAIFPYLVRGNSRKLKRSLRSCSWHWRGIRRAFRTFTWAPLEHALTSRPFPLFNDEPRGADLGILSQ